MLTIPLKPIAVSYLAAIAPIGSTITLATIVSLIGCAYVGLVFPPVLLAGLVIFGAYCVFMVTVITATTIVLSPV
jgi:hypothetical protein